MSFSLDARFGYPRQRSAGRSWRASRAVGLWMLALTCGSPAAQASVFALPQPVELPETPAPGVGPAAPWTVDLSVRRGGKSTGHSRDDIGMFTFKVEPNDPELAYRFDVVEGTSPVDLDVGAFRGPRVSFVWVEHGTPPPFELTVDVFAIDALGRASDRPFRLLIANDGSDQLDPKRAAAMALDDGVKFLALTLATALLGGVVATSMWRRGSGSSHRHRRVPHLTRIRSRRAASVPESTFATKPPAPESRPSFHPSEPSQ